MHYRMLSKKSYTTTILRIHTYIQQVSIHMCVCVFMCLMCLIEREREREVGGEKIKIN